MGSRRFWFRLAVVAGCGFVLRVAFVQWYSPHLHFGLDATWYQLTSGLIHDGHGLADPAAFFERGRVVATAFRVPLYPTFLAGVTAGFGADRHTFQLAGAVMGILTILLTGLLGREIAGHRVGLVAAALVAVSPALINVDASVMSETLQVPLITGVVLLASVSRRRRTVIGWIAVGGVLGLAMLTRSDAAVFAGVLVIGLLLDRAVPGRDRAMQAAVVTLVAIAIVTPWVLRNRQAVGTTTLSTIDSAEAIAGANCDPTYRLPDLGLWEPDCAQIRRPGLTEVERRDVLLRRGVDHAREHWTKTPVVATARVLRVWGLWNPVGQSRTEAVESRNTRWQLLTWVALLPTLALAVAGLAVARRRHLPVLPLVAMLVSVTVAAILTYAKQRLRAIAEPELVVLAAIAVVAWWGIRRPPIGTPPESDREVSVA